MTPSLAYRNAQMTHIPEADIDKNKQSQHFRTTMQEFIFSDDLRINAPYFDKNLMAFALYNDKDQADKAYLYGTSEENMKELEEGPCLGATEGLKKDLVKSKDLLMDFCQHYNEGQRIYDEVKINNEIG